MSSMDIKALDPITSHVQLVHDLNQYNSAALYYHQY